MSLTSWKKTLYAQVHRQPDELAMAAQLLFGGPPPEEHTEDFLDFFALKKLKKKYLECRLILS